MTAYIGYKSILERLYSDYYLKNIVSDVTSSYWKEYGSQSRIIKHKDDFRMSGLGFGTFCPRVSLKRIKYLLPHFLVKSLFRKYNPDDKIKFFGLEIVKKQGRALDFDSVKQILIASLLCECDIFQQCRVIAVIGDGYGFMTSLVKMICPSATVISVNLGKILMFDIFYAKKVLPDENTILLNEKMNADVLRKNSVVFLEAEKFDLLFGLPIDLFINIASMQEMDMNTIKAYFDMMRSGAGKGYFYCCNRVEKQLPDGTTIRFLNYPWHSKDEMIVDELCPWYQKYPISHPPFWKLLDGPTYHRLLKLYRLG